ncbi:MAG TPA: rhodanese-like domain-containing protein [Burkholderiaceae bacterium]
MRLPSPLLVLALALLAALAACSPSRFENIDNAKLQALIEQGVRVYDVRRPDEWRETGVIAGSRKLTFVDEQGRLMPEFAARFRSEVGPDDPVILICRVGNRTRALAGLLSEELGYKRVYNVRDGITGWLREGRAVARD